MKLNLDIVCVFVLNFIIVQSKHNHKSNDDSDKGDTQKLHLIDSKKLPNVKDNVDEFISPTGTTGIVRGIISDLLRKKYYVPLRISRILIFR